MEPDLHKGITISTSTKINTLLFADSQVIIANSEGNLQREYSHYKKQQKILKWKYHQKNLKQ